MSKPLQQRVVSLAARWRVRATKEDAIAVDNDPSALSSEARGRARMLRDCANEIENEFGAGSEATSAVVRRFPRRPGNGWKAYELAPVWEHASGIRIHSIGICRLADGTVINGEHWPECQTLLRAIREQGGTRRRGLMVWALAISSNDKISGEAPRQ